MAIFEDVNWEITYKILILRIAIASIIIILISFSGVQNYFELLLASVFVIFSMGLSYGAAILSNAGVPFVGLASLIIGNTLLTGRSFYIDST